ncbi:iron complex outermembrane receptor protein [Rhodanobacter sp. TND4EL1]
MRSIQVSRPAALAQAVALALVFCGSVSAQEPVSAGAPAGSSPQIKMESVSIPAQPVEAALDAFAAQTGLQVVYSGRGAVRNLQSPGFTGSAPADEILRRLLSSSDLVAEFVNNRTVAVRAPGAAASTRSTPAAAAMAAGASSDMAPASPVGSAPKIDNPSTMEAVTVIGTNLRNIDPASPVVIIDAELIESRGYSSIEDVLRHLPQNFASTSSTSVALAEREYGDLYSPTSTVGASSVNLRGLGSRSTLVLVDGHRRPGSAQAQGGYTDISSIPLSQVERIEVLSDGASAIYGADAVAGVVNIVLKKSYEGTVVQARHENSSSDADVTRLSLAHTFGWKGGKLTASADFRKTDPANISRYIHVGPDGQGDFSDRGGTNARSPNLSQPGAVFESEDYGIGYHFLGMPLGVIPGGQNGTNLQPDQLIPYDYDHVPTSYDVGRIGPKIRSNAFRLIGDQDVGNDLKLSWNVGQTRQKDSEHWHPIPFDFSFLEDGQTTYVPTTNPYNNFGEDVLVGYSYSKEFAGMTFTQEQKQTNTDYSVGLSGKLPVVRDWTFDLSYSGGIEKGQTDALGDITGSLGEEGYARTQAVLDGLNVFGDGNDPSVVAANRALLSTLVERYRYSFESKNNTVDLLTRGPLFELPAGKVQAAIGAQYRSERYHYQSTIGGLADSNTKRDATALFAEVGFPLLKDAAWAKELTLTVAARHESFDQSGTSSLQNGAYRNGADLVALGGFDLQSLVGTPPGDMPYETGPDTRVSRTYGNTSTQARLSWKPVNSLRLRATWGRSFLTPQPQQQFGLTYVDDGTSSVIFGGAQLPAGYTTLAKLRGPNANLKPQIATVKTVGFDYTPTFANGLTLSATYNDTFFDNYIGAPLAGLSYAQIFADIDKLPPGTFIKGNNGVLLWDSRDVNFLGRKSRSVDTTASWYFGNSLGDWRVELNAVRTLQLEAETLPSLPVTVFSDSEFGPSKWAADLSVGWENGPYFASAGTHFTSSHRVLQPLSADPNIYNNFTPNENPRRSSPSYTTFDFQVGYRWLGKDSWLSGSTARLGVQNAFDRAFPFVDNSYGFVSNRVDVRGRVIYLDLKKEF